MVRVIAASVLSAVLSADGFLPAQAPAQIQNGRVETRPATSIADAVTTLGASADPVWIGWRVPLVDGDRDLCTTYEMASVRVRTEYLDGTFLPSGLPPQVTRPAGPVPLEGGTSLVVLLRVVDRQVERLRRFGDDCPLDAGGRTVYWLPGVTPAESLRFLDGLIYQGAITPAVQSTFATWAIPTIGYHRDPGADTILERIATGDRDTELRKQAASRLALDRGARGFEAVRRLLGSERSADVRLSLVRSIGRTREPQTAEVLLALARTDAEASVRREAAYWYPQRAGAAGLDATIALINSDPEDSVKIRALAGLSLLPPDLVVPRLINLARTSTNQSVKKESVAALGRTKDPRAIAFLEELLRSR
jgi:hypothetical protein